MTLLQRELVLLIALIWPQRFWCWRTRGFIWLFKI